MSTQLDYLEDIIKVDTGLLVKAVEREAAGKQLSFISRSLDPEDQEVTVETLTTDIKISLGIDPLQARKAAHRLTRAKFVVPSISAEAQFEHDHYQRVNKTKNPVSALIADIAKEVADQEDAMILTITDITIGDNEGMMQSGNFTDAGTELNCSTFALGATTLAGLFTQLIVGDTTDAALNGMKGEVRKNPVILVITPLVESTAAGVFNTNGDKSVLQLWRETIVARGGPGSGILVAERLSCAMTFAQGEVVITNADESSVGRAALMVVTPKVMTSHTSVYDQRPRPYNKADGYYNKVVERFINLIHNKDGIVASHAVVLS